MTDAAPPEAQEVCFGAVCSAVWLYDIALRSTSHKLFRSKVLPPERARKKYGHEDVDNFTLIRPKDDSPILSDQPDALAFGTEWKEAVVLSDDCYIESCKGRFNPALSRREDPAGRIVLAPLRKRVADDEKDLRRMTALYACPLPASDHFPEDRVAVLWRAFSIDAAHIWNTDDDRSINSDLTVVRFLTEDGRSALAERWAAHSTRRGPLVAADNARKFDDILQKSGVTNETARRDIVDGLSDVADDYWQYEGNPMEAIADEYEAADTQGRTPEPQRVVPSLIEYLERLEGSVARLKGLLSSL